MNSNKIIYNTLIVYIQLIISTFISLFSIRFVLQALGEEDYGIYMLVAGTVSMLNVLSSTMSNTSMRFMSHSLGKNELLISLKTFNSTLFIHYCLAFIVIFILEIGGWIMFKYFLNIPEIKLLDARIVYQIMIITTIVTIVSIPYDAIINSHENLFFLSFVTIIQNIVQLCVALALVFYNTICSKLILYSFSLMIIQVILRFIKYYYAKRKYTECKINFKKYIEKRKLKEILSFTGWDFIRSLSSLCSTQLRGILINMFFGVRLNAAEGISKRINTQLNLVSTSITQAITPQMNKSEGGGDRQRMIDLMLAGVKFTTFMYCLLAIPLLLEIPYILNIWLKTVPEFTALFCQMCILILMLNKFTWQITNAIRAVGQIRDIQIVGSIISFAGIVIGYFIYKNGAGPLAIYLIELFLGIIYTIINLYYGKKILNLNLFRYFKRATLPVVLPLFFSLGIVLIIHCTLNQGLLRTILVFILYIIFDFIFFWFLGMNNTEHQKVVVLIKKTISSVNIANVMH